MWAKGDELLLGTIPIFLLFLNDGTDFFGVFSCNTYLYIYEVLYLRRSSWVVLDWKLGGGGSVAVLFCSLWFNENKNQVEQKSRSFSRSELSEQMRKMRKANDSLIITEYCSQNLGELAKAHKRLI